MIKTKQVTIVFQGHIDADKLGTGVTDGTDFLYNVARTREAFPDAKIFLSTWDYIELPKQYNSAKKMGINKLLQNPDPGGLPNIKFGYDHPNNVNRQIVSSAAGLNAVTTKYAMKLRADSFLVSDDVIKNYENYVETIHYYAPEYNKNNKTSEDMKALKNKSAKNSKKLNKDYSPIAVTNFFTVDPRVFEHMAYHVSDWAQFGTRKVLQHYWSAKLMTKKNATYFENNKHNTAAKFSDDQFRTRLAVEQHIAIEYAKSLGFKVPKYYNEINEKILTGHDRFLAEHFIILDLAQFGLSFPKYAWTVNDEFMQLNCVHNDDWYLLFNDYWHINQPDKTKLDNAKKRLERKLENSWQN